MKEGGDDDEDNRCGGSLRVFLWAVSRYIYLQRGISLKLDFGWTGSGINFLFDVVML